MSQEDVADRMIAYGREHPDEMDLIGAIVSRAMSLPWPKDREPSPTNIMMDVLAVHTHGRPLLLVDFATADDFDFVHDIVGIRRHLDRETGQLDEHFVPRFSAPAVQEKRHG